MVLITDRTQSSTYGEPNLKEVEHRGLRLALTTPYFHWRIVPRPGFYLPRRLEGTFLSEQLLKNIVDVYLAEIGGDANSIWIPIPEKPRRGRPPTKNKRASAHAVKDGSKKVKKTDAPKDLQNNSHH